MMRLPTVEQPPCEREDEAVRNIWESLGWWNQVVKGIGRTGTAETAFGSENDGRNIVLAMNVDGFQPFRKVATSMTPYQFMILNLPEQLRHRAGFLILSALHPGRTEPKYPPAYLNTIVDELLSLWKDGLTFSDPLDDGEQKVVRVKLLLSCADLPAHGHNNCQQGSSAYNGCFKCEIRVRETDTQSIQMVQTGYFEPIGLLLTHLFAFGCFLG